MLICLSTGLLEVDFHSDLYLYKFIRSVYIPDFLELTSGMSHNYPSYLLAAKEVYLVVAPAL